MSDLTDLLKGIPAHRELAKKATIVFDDSDRFVVKAKAANTDHDLKKGKGEGSRGGKIVGHTRSGKPIYASKGGEAFHSHHKDMTHSDHRQAEKHHQEEKSNAYYAATDKKKARQVAKYHILMAQAHDHASKTKHYSYSPNQKREAKAEAGRLADIAAGHHEAATTHTLEARINAARQPDKKSMRGISNLQKAIVAYDEAIEKATLTTEGRKRIKESNFALSGRRYPIQDATHARNALARVAQHGTAEEIRQVKRAVKRKYPSIDVGGDDE